MIPQVDATAPGVSVVLPCYNAEGTLARALDSVLSQTDVVAEAIVVDDGSTDGTARLLARYREHIMWISAPNRGAPVARNAGLSLARHGLVMFLDADDFLLPDTLAGLARALDADGADCVLAPVYRVSGQNAGHVIARPRLAPRAALLADWVTGRFVPPCGILWRRETLHAIGGWDESLTKDQDGDLFVRALAAGACPTCSTTGGAVYWDVPHPDRISRRVTQRALADSFRVLRRAHALARAWEAEAEALPTDPHCEVAMAFSSASHRLERLAARNGARQMEQEIARYRAAEGWPAAVGGKAHVVLSRLLGLRWKEVLSRRLRLVA